MTCSTSSTSTTFQYSSPHEGTLPATQSRGDERLRIENAGGFIQYDRLMGKCTLSRCFGQFEYKVRLPYPEHGGLPEQHEGEDEELPELHPGHRVVRPGAEQRRLHPAVDGRHLPEHGHQRGGTPLPSQTDFIAEKYSKLEAEESPNKILSSIIENCKIISPDSDNIACILIIIRKGLVGAPKAW